MRVYLMVLAKSGAELPTAADLAGHTRKTLPFDATSSPHATWQHQGRVALYAWHNEPEQADRPLVTTAIAGASGYSGYCAQAPDGRVAAGSAGVWASFSAGPDGVRASTSASGTEMVFYSETARWCVIGNRASLVHLVANGGVVDLDPVGLAAIANAGFHTTARTTFDGVTSLDPATEVVASTQGLRVRPLEADEGASASVDDVARALLESVSGMPDGNPVRLGLTGGRDSRLLAALLTRAGVPVLARTAGFDDDPDVVVARDVARVLGIPHTVQARADAKRSGDDLLVDPQSRIREAVALGEGSLSAYDKVGRLHQDYDADLVPFSGSGGEILRGYYASSLDGMELAEVARRVFKRRAHQREKLLHPGVRAAYLDDLAGWREWVNTDPAVALESFYVRQRTGRWSGVARGSSSTGSLAWRPFFDHAVVRTVRRTPLDDRTSERLFADLLSALAPELADVPFAGKRWKSDAKPPTGAAERAAWDRRAPLTSARGGDQSSYQWRTDSLEVRRELRHVIDQAPAELWEVLDESNVGRLLDQDAPSRADVVTTWHLATIASTVATRGGTTIDKLDPALPTHQISVTPSVETTARPPSVAKAKVGKVARSTLRGLARVKKPRPRD